MLLNRTCSLSCNDRSHASTCVQAMSTDMTRPQRAHSDVGLNHTLLWQLASARKNVRGDYGLRVLRGGP
jgi:hypothetical protein